MKNIFSFLKSRELYYAIVRYALSVLMMSFGFMKILGMQFNAILGPVSSYQQPLEYLTGRQLTWAFLGYSHWFQVLLGVFEFVPATFILFRRTAFAGAVFLLPMAVGVFLINFGLNLWSNTRLDSIVLLLLNLSIFLFEWNKVKQISVIVFGTQKAYKYIVPEIIVAAILISFPVMRKGHADYGKSYQNVLTGDWFHQHPVEYTLVSEKINDSTLPHHLLKSFFGSWEEYSEINGQTNNWDGYKKYSVNEQKHLLDISESQKRTDRIRDTGYYYLTGSFLYELQGDTLLVLHKNINDSTQHTWVFRKRVMSPNKDY